MLFVLKGRVGNSKWPFIPPSPLNQFYVLPSLTFGTTANLELYFLRICLKHLCIGWRQLILQWLGFEPEKRAVRPLCRHGCRQGVQCAAAACSTWRWDLIDACPAVVVPKLWRCLEHVKCSPAVALVGPQWTYVSARSADPAAASLLGERSAETRVRTSPRHFT